MQVENNVKTGATDGSSTRVCAKCEKTKIDESSQVYQAHTLIVRYDEMRRALLPFPKATLANAAQDWFGQLSVCRIRYCQNCRIESAPLLGNAPGTEAFITDDGVFLAFKDVLKDGKSDIKSCAEAPFTSCVGLSQNPTTGLVGWCRKAVSHTMWSTYWVQQCKMQLTVLASLNKLKFTNPEIKLLLALRNTELALQESPVSLTLPAALKFIVQCSQHCIHCLMEGRPRFIRVLASLAS